MSKLENKLFKCERCQIENANIVCQVCQPFHYFCQRCDSIVHSMRVKSSHKRQNISSFINKALNSSFNDNNNYSTAKFGEINNELNLPNSAKKYFRTLTPKKQRIIYNNKLNDKDNISSNNDYIINNNNYPISNDGYSKDYLYEINRIHNKEKEALQYKIDTLENNIERLKLNFQNELKLMEERMNNILREKKNLKEKNQKLEEKNQKLEERVEEMEKLLLLPYKENLAKELQKQKDMNRIKEWISPGKDIKFKLLFKKSTDGNTTKDFHDLCDNKGKTLIIIETIEGRKFGGVTYDDWNTNNSWRTNPKDFVFSLDLNKKYNYSGSGCTTVGDITYGFAFGDYRTSAVDICFNNKSLNEGISNSSPSFKTNKELNNGNEMFRTKEIEVYKIIMD